jgi:hypothetical protein
MAKKVEKEIEPLEAEALENAPPVIEEPAKEEKKPEPVVAKKQEPAAVPMKSIRALMADTYQYNKSTYAFAVGQVFNVEQPLADSLVARGEALPV